eukprot:jgi/Mesvir1/905/Mv17466-RA.1
MASGVCPKLAVALLCFSSRLAFCLAYGQDYTEHAEQGQFSRQPARADANVPLLNLPDDLYTWGEKNGSAPTLSKKEMRKLEQEMQEKNYRRYIEAVHKATKGMTDVQVYEWEQQHNAEVLASLGLTEVTVPKKRLKATIVTRRIKHGDVAPYEPRWATPVNLKYAGGGRACTSSRQCARGHVCFRGKCACPIIVALAEHTANGCRPHTAPPPGWHADTLTWCIRPLDPVTAAVEVYEPIPCPSPPPPPATPQELTFEEIAPQRGGPSFQEGPRVVPPGDGPAGHYHRRRRGHHPLVETQHEPAQGGMQGPGPRVRRPHVAENWHDVEDGELAATEQGSDSNAVHSRGHKARRGLLQVQASAGVGGGPSSPSPANRLPPRVGLGNRIMSSLRLLQQRLQGFDAVRPLSSLMDDSSESEEEEPGGGHGDGGRGGVGRSAVPAVDMTRPTEGCEVPNIYSKLGLRVIHSRGPDLPLLADWSSCAVVGSSVVLLDAPKGAEINTHSAVIRFNDAPTMGYEGFVGNFTTLRLQGKNYCGFREDTREILLNYTPHKDCATSSVAMTQAFYDYELRMFEWATHNGTMFPSDFLPSDRDNFEVRKLSAGFLGIVLAAHMCGEVHIYGYSENPAHYYDKIETVKPFSQRHNWSLERRCLQNLSEGLYGQRIFVHN